MWRSECHRLHERSSQTRKRKFPKKISILCNFYTLIHTRERDETNTVQAPQNCNFALNFRRMRKVQHRNTRNTLCLKSDIFRLIFNL